METRKIIGSKVNPAYDRAPYEFQFAGKNGDTKDALGQDLIGPFPYRYDTLEHAMAACEPGADTRINTVWPFLPLYEGET